MHTNTFSDVHLLFSQINEEALINRSMIILGITQKSYVMIKLEWKE